MNDAYDIGIRQGMEKVALSVSPQVLNTAITGAFLGASVAPPEQRIQYMLMGAAGGGILGRHLAKADRAATIVGGS